MARPTTDELKYYSRDTKSQENEQYIEAMHGIIGFAILEKLRMHIYGGTGGYYCEFNQISRRLFCKANGINLDQLENVLKDCFLPEIRLFDETLYNKHQILTSAGIQKRWKKIVTESGRKKTLIRPEYNLLTEEQTPPAQSLPPVSTPVNSHTSGLTGGETPDNPTGSTQTKLNETKLNQKKEKDNRSVEGGGAPPAPDGSSSEDLKKGVGKKKFVAPALAEVQNYFSDKTKGSWRPELSKLEGQKFFNHYSSNGWKQNGSKSIVDWQAAANGWILRQPEYSQGPGAPVPALQQAGTDPATMEKEIEFLYQRYLENDLKPGLIQPPHCDYLRKKKITVDKLDAKEILKKCASIRRSQLEGSNEGSKIRLGEAYEKYDPENALIIADQPQFFKLTKVAAVEKIFETYRIDGMQTIFQKEPVTA